MSLNHVRYLFVLPEFTRKTKKHQNTTESKVPPHFQWSEQYEKVQTLPPILLVVGTSIRFQKQNEIFHFTITAFSVSHPLKPF